MKYFILMFIAFTIGSFSKTAYATFELHYGIGLPFQGEITLGNQSLEKDGISLTAHLDLLWALPIDIGIGSTRIGLRSQGYTARHRASISNSIQAAILSFIVNQQFLGQVTQSGRGLSAEAFAAIGIFRYAALGVSLDDLSQQLDSTNIVDQGSSIDPDVMSFSKGDFLGGGQIGAKVGYKLTSSFSLKMELGYLWLALPNWYDLSAPYLSLGVSWLFGQPSGTYIESPLEG